MPIYEYLCPQCNGRFQKLVHGFSDPAGLACPRCGNTGVSRAVSLAAVVRSEDARIDAMGDERMFAGLDENDPASVARWAKKLGKELGEEAGDDWNEMVDQMMDEEMDRDSDGGGTPGRPDSLGWG